MQIHELNEATTATTDVLATDNGTDTFKAKPGDLRPGYTSEDSASPSGYQSVPVMSNGSTLSVLLNLISKVVANTRWLYTKIYERLPSTVAPLMDGTANVGTSTRYAREDHVHPSDTSKQDVLTAGDHIQIDGTTISAIYTPSSASPKMNGTASPGNATEYSRGDHTHPTDTSRFATTGGIITGSVRVKDAYVSVQDTDFDRTETPTVYKASGTFAITDYNNQNLSFMQAIDKADGAHYTRVGVVANPGTAGAANVGNNLDLGVKTDGTFYVGVTSPAAWRAGLQLSVMEVVVENKTATLSSVAANSASTGATLNVAKSGYTFLGVVGASASTNAVVFGRFSRASDTTVGYFVRNVTASAVSNVTLTFNCLYYR